MANTIYHNTYWNHRGRYEKTVAKLQRRIPTSGEVKNADKNPALEMLRGATNCYYDLYNNGLCNRADEFHTLFNVWPPRDTEYRGYYELTPEVVKDTERVMNRFIVRAAKEQGFTLA